MLLRLLGVVLGAITGMGIALAVFNNANGLEAVFLYPAVIGGVMVGALLGYQVAAIFEDED